MGVIENSRDGGVVSGKLTFSREISTVVPFHVMIPRFIVFIMIGFGRHIAYGIRTVPLDMSWGKNATKGTAILRTMFSYVFNAVADETSTR